MYLIHFEYIPIPVTPSARIPNNSVALSLILKKRVPLGSTSILADAALFIESELPSTFQPPILAPVVTVSFPVVISVAAILVANKLPVISVSASIKLVRIYPPLIIVFFAVA